MAVDVTNIADILEELISDIQNFKKNDPKYRENTKKEITASKFNEVFALLNDITGEYPKELKYEIFVEFDSDAEALSDLLILKGLYIGLVYIDEFTMKILVKDLETFIGKLTGACSNLNIKRIKPNR